MTTGGSPPQWWTDGLPCPKCGQVHQRAACHKTNGEPCGRWPRRGHWVCPKHGGGTPQVRSKAAENLARDKATAELARLGIGQGQLPGDPAEVMLELLAKARWNIARYELAIAQLEVRLGPINDLDNVALLLESWSSEGSTLKLAPHTLIELYNAERREAARLAEACRRCGAQERMAEIDAEVGRQMVELLRAVFGELFALMRADANAGRLDLARLEVIETSEAPELIVRHATALTPAAPTDPAPPG